MWEIENRGSAPVFELTIDAERLDADGVVIDERPFMVTHEDRVLYPGEVRLEQWLFKVAKPGRTFRFKVR